MKWQDITSYDLFITSFKGTLTEPPITMRLTQEEVLEVAEDPSKLRLTPDPTKLMREPSTEPGLETIPCHTQPVERMIGFVTKVSANYPAGDRMEEEISNCLYSRELMFQSKQDYVSHQAPPVPLVRRRSI